MGEKSEDKTGIKGKAGAIRTQTTIAEKGMRRLKTYIKVSRSASVGAGEVTETTKNKNGGHSKKTTKKTG